MLDPDLLAAATGCTRAIATVWAGPLSAAMQRYGITTRRRAAHFLAQIGHESGSLTRTEERLDYSARRLLEVWPGRFDAASARSYAHQPERIANRVYARRMGNGDEASGDGWRYRGRSPIQLTGRDNYRHMGDMTGLPLLDRPDLALQVEHGATIAAAWWQENGLNALADTGDILAVSRRLNLGTVNTSRMPAGLRERIARTHRASAALEAQT
ncbi:MAG: glycoside hydrolase family 19 protein [Thermomonas hydrothermalis]|nr:glycoside hydrolase family 19 protein [Thermomonas hydrothermalis]